MILAAFFTHFRIPFTNHPTYFLPPSERRQSEVAGDCQEGSSVHHRSKSEDPIPSACQGHSSAVRCVCFWRWWDVCWIRKLSGYSAKAATPPTARDLFLVSSEIISSGKKYQFVWIKWISWTTNTLGKQWWRSIGFCYSRICLEKQRGKNGKKCKWQTRVNLSLNKIKIY